jgi:hypothetical protein
VVNVREPLDPKISLWHFLAFYLRFQREKQGLSLAQWGQIIGAARSTVSNIEAGRLKLYDDQAKAIDRKCDTGDLFQLLLYYARTAHDPDWFRSYTEYEATAHSIKIYHGQAVPGPLQTEAYARALLTVGSRRDIDTTVGERMTRQEAILNRADPPLLWVLLDEGALAVPVGGPGMMTAQLQRLRDMAELPHVSLRVIPRTAGAHLGFDGPFRIISLESRDIAYTGAQSGGRLVEGTQEVRALGVKFDRIGAKALSEDGSRTLIERLQKDMG